MLSGCIILIATTTTTISIIIIIIVIIIIIIIFIKQCVSWLSNFLVFFSSSSGLSESEYVATCFFCCPRTIHTNWFTDGLSFKCIKLVFVLQKEVYVGVMYVQQSSVSSILGRRLSLIVWVNLALNRCRTVVVDSDWLSGSHPLSQSE